MTGISPGTALTGVEKGYKFYTYFRDRDKPTELDIINARFDEVIALSNQIIEGVDAALLNQAKAVLLSVKTDMIESLSAYGKFLDLGDPAEKVKAVNFSQSAMATLQAFVNDGLYTNSDGVKISMSPIIFAATGLRLKLAQDLEDGDLAGSLNGDILAAQSMIATFLPQLRQEAENNLEIRLVSDEYVSEFGFSQTWRMTFEAVSQSDPTEISGRIYHDYESNVVFSNVRTLIDFDTFEGGITYTLSEDPIAPIWSFDTKLLIA